jgi:hypothetical protein
MTDTPSAKLVKEVHHLRSFASYIFLPLLCTFRAALANFPLDEVHQKAQK